MTTETNDAASQDVIADYAIELQQIENEGYELAVRKARNALYWAAGLYFFWEMIGMLRSEEGFNVLWLVIAIVESGIFVALALWTKSRPYSAVLSGLIYFGALTLLVAVSYGIQQGSTGVFKALFSGIIVKVIIIINLVRPLGDARELQRSKKAAAEQRNIL